MNSLMILFVASDIDECGLRPGPCAQLCDNDPGSFRCGCRQGFILDPDRRTCNGEQVH